MGFVQRLLCLELPGVELLVKPISLDRNAVAKPRHFPSVPRVCDGPMIERRPKEPDTFDVAEADVGPIVDLPTTQAKDWRPSKTEISIKKTTALISASGPPSLNEKELGVNPSGRWRNSTCGSHR
jgi:hypothetical protein